MTDKIFVITGATATGKTAVAVELAKKTRGEVVSADSMQVYRGMDSGTAKPSVQEMAGIPHHLLDIIDPDTPFSAAEFQKRAVAAIGDIHSRGGTPILAGGTGFYINAVLYSTEFSSEESEWRLRDNFAAMARKKGAEFLHEKLKKADPVYAETVHPNNVKRVARALAYCDSTGDLFSEYNERQKKAKESHVPVYVLSFPREVLYKRINVRVVSMFEAGLVDEVRGLLAKGYHKGLAAMLGIGYKETVQFINGELTRDEAIEAVQQATRYYAKRQETWFRNQVKNVSVLNAERKSPGELAEEILGGN